MRKRKRNTFIHFGPVGSPYMTADKESMDEWYALYLRDGAGSIDENGSDYYRIISVRAVSTDRGEFILVCVDRKLKASIGAFCRDETGNLFRVRAIEQIHFCGPTPEWYRNTLGLLLEGTDVAIGEYLAAT